MPVGVAIREMQAQPDGTTIVRLNPCVFCGKENTVRASTEGVVRWLQGQKIQYALPELTPGERETLMNGSCEACFDKAFGEVSD